MSFSFLRNWGTGRRTPVRRGTRGRMNMLTLEERTVPAVAFAAAAGANGPAGSQVIVYDETATEITRFDAYPGFTGGVRVAVGDVTGDGTPDIVTAPGFGGFPVVRIFDGAALEGGIVRSIRDFYCFAENFTGGVFVATGDLDADGLDDVVVGPGAGAPPIVNGFSGATGAQIVVFFAFTNAINTSFTGGVRVACADVGGDNGGTPGGKGDDEIICGSGAGIDSIVTVWEYDGEFYNPDRFVNFAPYESGFTGGVYVGGGRITNNMDDQGFIYSDIITGPGEGGGPLLRVFSTDDASDRDNYIQVLARSRFVYDPNARTGLRVAGIDTIQIPPVGGQQFPLDTILTSVGFALPTNPANAPTGTQQGLNLFTTDAPEPPAPSEIPIFGVNDTFTTYDPTYQGGVYVG